MVLATFVDAASHLCNGWASVRLSRRSAACLMLSAGVCSKYRSIATDAVLQALALSSKRA